MFLTQSGNCFGADFHHETRRIFFLDGSVCLPGLGLIGKYSYYILIKCTYIYNDRFVTEKRRIRWINSPAAGKDLGSVTDLG